MPVVGSRKTRVGVPIEMAGCDHSQLVFVDVDNQVRFGGHECDRGSGWK